VSDEGAADIEVVVARAVAQALKARAAEKSAKEMLTQAEAATLMGVSVSTIRNWLREGKLTRYGTGKVVRIARAELLALKEAPSSPPDPKAPAEDADAWARKMLGRRG
jgi:excisionase family DNA binding protein